MRVILLAMKINMAELKKKKKKIISKKKILKKKVVKKAPSKKLVKKPVKKLLKKIIKKSVRPVKKIIKKPTKKKVVKKTTKKVVKNKVVKFEKHESNPIIAPSLYDWESVATFNPSAVEIDGKIHIMYRAIGGDDQSSLAYANTKDGFNIDERLTHFVYKRFMDNVDFCLPIFYDSGGGWSGGCEDPRLVVIGDRVYMTYTAFDGWGSVRLALTSIKKEDFKNKKWKWEKSIFLSPPGEIHKNWVIFPEKIKGKFAVLHSFYPEILVDYFDDLNTLDGKGFIKSNNTRPVDASREWDSWFRGVGPAPIKTKDGWLVFYHAMDHRNSDRYRMGALLLDLKNPTKILYRSKNPILEPEEHYENHGHKWGVVYSCGAVIKDKNLFIYYGGADKYVAVASIPLRELLADLKKNKVIKLKKGKPLKK